MKINKKGFTLMELLGVIIILSLLMLIVLPNIVNSVKNSSSEIDEVSEKLIYDSVDLYISDNKNYYSAKNGSEFCIQLNTLVNESYLKSPIKYSNFNDITNTHSIKVTYNNDYNYEIVENSSCPGMVCKRATSLHTEECTQNEYYCNSSGYTEDGLKGTTTITYGSLGTTGILNSGDAFDCDVNGDGAYDSETERFYYVTDLDSSTAVLIYYNNTLDGVANNTSSSEKAYSYYDSSNYVNNIGPTIAVTNLPTTSQWNNVDLKNSKRQITNELGETNTTNGHIFEFDYSGYAARFLTIQEIQKSCNITIGSYTAGELDNCNYLMENTKYSDSSIDSKGYWLENPLSSSNNVMYAFSSPRATYYTVPIDSQGVRPVIEVPKFKIQY